MLIQMLANKLWKLSILILIFQNISYNDVLPLSQRNEICMDTVETLKQKINHKKHILNRNRRNGKDTLKISSELEQDLSKLKKYYSFINDNKFTYELIVNGVHQIIKKEQVKVIIPPSGNTFDTIYVNHHADKPDDWKIRVCRIPFKQELTFKINPCCGGLEITPNTKRTLLITPKNIEGKLYLARFGYSGKILINDKTILFDSVCVNSAMENVFTRINIEEIDTGLSKYKYNKAVNSTTSLIERLISFNGVRYDDYYFYRIKKRLFSLDYEWLDGKPLLITFDGKTGEVTLCEE